jgi:antitoxin VapB
VPDNLTVMAFEIDDPAAEATVRELAAVTGESIDTAVAIAARERLERIQGIAPAELRLQALRRIAEHAAALPVLDPRSPDEILGYDEHGLPS